MVADKKTKRTVTSKRKTATPKRKTVASQRTLNTEKPLQKATKSSRIKTAKKLLDEGKLKPGHITRLGVKKQTPPKPTSYAADRERKAMLPGYRVSASGKMYYEARENRSDTPKQRKDAAYAKTHSRKGTRAVKNTLGKVPDRYVPSRVAVERPPIVRRTGGRRRDNYLVEELEGHWFDNKHEFKILEAKDGTDKGKWFLWYRDLPAIRAKEHRFDKRREWALLSKEAFGDTLKEAIDRYEKCYKVKVTTGIQGGLKYLCATYRMTKGMHNYLEKLESDKRPAEASDKALISIIRKYEREICKIRDHEEIIGISEFGDVLYQSYGGRSSCRLPLWVTWMSKIDCHNHPGENGWFGPSTFSIKTSVSNPRGGDIESFSHAELHGDLAGFHRTCSDGVAFTLYHKKLNGSLLSTLRKKIVVAYTEAKTTEAYKNGSPADRYGIFTQAIREVFKLVLPKEIYFEEKL